MAHLPHVTGYWISTDCAPLFFGAKRDNKEVAGEVSSVGFVLKFLSSLGQ